MLLHFEILFLFLKQCHRSFQLNIKKIPLFASNFIGYQYYFLVLSFLETEEVNQLKRLYDKWISSSPGRKAISKDNTHI